MNGDGNYKLDGTALALVCRLAWPQSAGMDNRGAAGDGLYRSAYAQEMGRPEDRDRYDQLTGRYIHASDAITHGAC